MNKKATIPKGEEQRENRNLGIKKCCGFEILESWSRKSKGVGRNIREMGNIEGVGDILDLAVDLFNTIVYLFPLPSLSHNPKSQEIFLIMTDLTKRIT